MNCPSRRATAISPAGRSIRARIPTVVPERTAGPRRSVRWCPASADDRPRTYHKTWHRCRMVAGSQAGVAPGRLPQKTGRKGIPSPRPPQASRQPGVVQQSYNRAHPPKLVNPTPTHLCIQPFSLAIRNPKPSASYVVVVVALLHLSYKN